MKSLAFVFGIGILFASCSPNLTHFSQRLYDENRWTESDLKKIQFYLSQDIVLKRRINEGSSEIINGKIKMEKGQQIEEILIPRGTPGIFLFSPKENRFAVSFESDSDKKFLMFGPNPKISNRFVLLATDWDRQQGRVQYNDKFYYVDSDDAMAGLLVDLRRINKVSVDSHTAKGRKVDE